MSFTPQKKTAKTIDAIRKLLNTRYVIRAKNPKAFQVIFDHQKYLESYFDIAGADLIVNETLGIAYLESNPEDDSICDYTFGKTQSLTAAETFGLILLRQQRNDYYTSPEENENPILDEEKFREAIGTVVTAKTDKDFLTQYDRMMKKFREIQFLYGPEDGPKFISPVVDVTLPGDEVAKLKLAATDYFNSKNSDEAQR